MASSLIFFIFDFFQDSVLPLLFPLSLLLLLLLPDGPDSLPGLLVPERTPDGPGGLQQAAGLPTVAAAVGAAVAVVFVQDLVGELILLLFLLPRSVVVDVDLADDDGEGDAAAPRERGRLRRRGQGRGQGRGAGGGGGDDGPLPLLVSLAAGLAPGEAPLSPSVK